MKTAGKMLLTEDVSFSRDTPYVNNNLMVVGLSGSGKTRSVVVPNILQANGSYIVSDPKGTLYRNYKSFFIKNGYQVKNYDLVHMNKAHYNPFAFANQEADVHRIAHVLTADPKGDFYKSDPFWQETSEMLLEVLIHIMMEHFRYKDKVTMRSLMELVTLLTANGNGNGKPMEGITELVMDIQSRNPNSIAVQQYRRFYSICDAEKTLACILMTLNGKLNVFAGKEILAMTDHNDFDFKLAGHQKMIIFVTVSDTDRSYDSLANLFFTQAIYELCKEADAIKGGALPVCVNFVLDDFATNLRLEEFPRIISTIRARNISAMVILQSEQQLKDYYGPNAETVVTNCGTYVYLGGSDIETADHVAIRADVPLKEVLNMKVGEAWVFRRGCDPHHGRLINLDKYMKKHGVFRE